MEAIIERLRSQDTPMPPVLKPRILQTHEAEVGSPDLGDEAYELSEKEECCCDMATD